MDKLKVAVLFGGQSGEHEVSRVSATSIINNIDREKYEVYMVGITKKGQWYLYSGDVDKIATGEWEKEAVPALIGPSTMYKGIIAFKDGSYEFYPIDVVFPVLHGPNGEDGTVQGLLELLEMPYVGPNVLSSSLCMDKVFSKRIFLESGIPTPKFTVVYRKDLNDVDKHDKIRSEITQKIGYPCFVKPANMGSSVGITKVHNEGELIDALKIAAKYDRKIIVEEGIDAREIECSVLGNDNPEASVAGEIVPAHEFYDYDAKYFDEASKLFIPAPIPDAKMEEIRDLAIKAYMALDVRGMARVDFLMDKNTGKVYLNELNTIPGFTQISMYPKLWEASGKPYSKLIDELIQLALSAYNEKCTNW
ncbi:D-alanine--D-alanine ligase A [Thermoanaerobacterium sp. PSU-2]|uniref:D-alanine--D-alanine ligase family protein n=1 Tax=Thermoanaerobacterium sp. PSU-2 TaxID=1930849 RepID=UPI000A151FA4|nr:D-alanine--D-alanine ligase family protein [Thermoanaerobacterium sp. PSU-2]ORX23611.1 D-alanine--D-alanine ligase A [Thermoanaerobacterium sp. PSU-2]HHV73841.1 D-alanine--D-alanine ligase [Thermoanaerobacterium sp.]